MKKSKILKIKSTGAVILKNKREMIKMTQE